MQSPFFCNCLFGDGRALRNEKKCISHLVGTGNYAFGVFCGGSALSPAFVLADNQSRQSGVVDHAYIYIQNAAEVLKHHRGRCALAARDAGGQWNGEEWIIYYDDSWKITDKPSAFCLRAKLLPVETEYLGTAQLAVTDTSGSVLAELHVSWQEVDP